MASNIRKLLEVGIRAPQIGSLPQHSLLCSLALGYIPQDRQVQARGEILLSAVLYVAGCAIGASQPTFATLHACGLKIAPGLGDVAAAHLFNKLLNTPPQ